MRLLLLNQFFHPDLSATSQLATDLAVDLAAAGIEVTALASRGTYLGGEALPRRDRYEGVEIVRVAATSLGLVDKSVDRLWWPTVSFFLPGGAARNLEHRDHIKVIEDPAVSPGVFVCARRGQAIAGASR